MKLENEQRIHLIRNQKNKEIEFPIEKITLFHLTTTTFILHTLLIYL